METAKHGLIKPDERDKEAVQELLKLQKENAELASDKAHHFQEALQEEFHRVWDETIKPALEQLKDTTEELLERFTDFEDDFRGYLKNKKPDVDVELLEEIFGDTLKSKDSEEKAKAKPELTDQT